MTALNASLKEQILQKFKKVEAEDGEEDPTSEISGSEAEGVETNDLLAGSEQSPLLKVDSAQAPRGEDAPTQPSRRQNRGDDEQDISMAGPNTNHVGSPSRHATELELELLDDLETTEVFKMRDAIKTYIRQHVWLQREGLCLKIKALAATQKRNRKLILKKDMEAMNLRSEISTLKQLCQEQEDRYKEQAASFDAMKQQLLDLTNQHQKITQEKSRLIGVNQILEQKIKVERSEKMSMINDLEHLELQDELAAGAADANQSVISGISGMSRLSMKYGGQRGAGRMTSFIKQSKQNLSMRRTPYKKGRPGLVAKPPGSGHPEADMQSINSQQALWMKNRVREEADFDQYSQFQENLGEPSDIDFSQMSAMKSRRDQGDVLDIDSEQFNNSQSINMSHFKSQIVESPGEHGTGSSFNNKLSSRRREQSSMI